MTAPPPPTLDAPHSADLARQRIAQKSRLSLFSSLPNLKFKAKHKDLSSTDEANLTSAAAASSPAPTIRINNRPVTLPDDDDKYQDKYEWAVLYENQRGVTLFSIPYYSSNSLLPSDPSPFTLPSPTPLKSSHQPTVSLKEYPLPDGNWKWVSKTWMIDMRNDSGEVQHDGFEYNWMFRKHHWHAQVGPLSAGGWVRRRRWVRLMMRPGQKRKLLNEAEDDNMNSAVSPVTATHSEARNSWNGWDTGHPLSFTPSVHSQSIYTRSTGSHESINMLQHWCGEVDEDWKMCRESMRMAGSDGAKLELWKSWLGLDDVDESKAVNTDDNANDEITAPPLEYVTAVLRARLPVILKESLMFPESRRQLVELFDKANILSQLPISSSIPSALEFWSLNSEVHLPALNNDDVS